MKDPRTVQQRMISREESEHEREKEGNETARNAIINRLVRHV